MSHLVASVVSVLNVAHVRADACNTKYTRLLIKEVCHLLWLLSEFLH